jgi:hypothetical protein
MPTSVEPAPTENARDHYLERRLVVGYAVLTCAIFFPLLGAFVFLRSFYPVAAWTVMMAGGNLQRGRAYYILRGETMSGETVDIQAIELTNALYSRTWTMVNATVSNESFKLRSLHPSNAAMLASAGGVENLPAGARLPELLQTWGELYNNQQPASSPRRLKAIRIDMYHWDGRQYGDYDKFVESWRKEL